MMIFGRIVIFFVGRVANPLLSKKTAGNVARNGQVTGKSSPI